MFETKMFIVKKKLKININSGIKEKQHNNEHNIDS